MDGPELLVLLREYRVRTRQPVLVVHGHHHGEYRRQAFTGEEAIHIHGHPSSTMGVEAKGRLDAVMRYSTISLGTDWHVQTTEL